MSKSTGARRRPIRWLPRAAHLLVAAAALVFALRATAAPAAAPAPAAAAQKVAEIDNSDCFSCHDDAGIETTGPDGKTRSIQVVEKDFTASIHGGNRCTSCHDDIAEVPHPDGFKPKPVSCSKCHRVEAGIYLKSDHGTAVHQGVAEAASCKDCHGATHTLLSSRNPASPVNRLNIPQTCGRCHSNEQEMAKFNLRQRNPVASYDSSVHGVAFEQKKMINAAVCTDCHGSHDLHRSTNTE